MEQVPAWDCYYESLVELLHLTTFPAITDTLSLSESCNMKCLFTHKLLHCSFHCLGSTIQNVWDAQKVIYNPSSVSYISLPAQAVPPYQGKLYLPTRASWTSLPEQVAPPYQSKLDLPTRASGTSLPEQVAPPYQSKWHLPTNLPK